MEAAPVEREGKRRTGHDLPPLRRGRPKPAVEPLQVGVRLDGACRGRTWALPPGAHPHGRSIGTLLKVSKVTSYSDTWKAMGHDSTSLKSQ